MRAAKHDPIASTVRRGFLIDVMRGSQVLDRETE
jgi:hypothetical protein